MCCPMWIRNVSFGKELKGVFEYRTLVKLSGPNNKEVTGGKIKFYDANRHNLHHHHPSVIIAMIKSDNALLMGHLTRVGETGNSCKLLV